MKKQQNSLPKETVQVALLEVPYGEPNGGYCSLQVESRLTPRQSAALKAVLVRLREDGEFCDMGGMSDPRGKRVEEAPHVIRYLLDKIAEAIESDMGVDLVNDCGLTF